jgi:hypothetical protein|tara:strand:- start:144 stop:308 length:165 start_codon:yes stop_codon:yes gene_type:complete
MDKHELLKELIHAVSYFTFNPSAENYTALVEAMLKYQDKIKGIRRIDWKPYTER